MLKKQWPVAAAILLMALHTGCSGTDRFNRQQYAQLDVDPFLSEDTDLEKSGGEAGDSRMASTVTEVTPSSDLEKTHDVSKSTNGSSGLLSDSEDHNPVNSTAIASAVRNDGNSRTRSSHARQPVDAGSGFDAWLEKRKGQVVQASGQFDEKIRGSGSSARQKVQQVDYSVFPSEQQSIGIQDPETGEMRAKKNSLKQSDKPAAQAPESTGNRNLWPPKNFEFP